MRARRAVKPFVAALALAGLLAGTSARGQISPGPLSRPHAKLEGSARCLDCHDPAQGVSATKCLACHKALRARIDAGRGLHARAEYRDCKTCHVEHQGQDFELVWWGKEGRQAFDHALTGYRLEGKHETLSCAQCHKERSFLGAPASCASCHADRHGGEFAGRSCGECHGQTAWRPAAGFDHANTRWPLTGAHLRVACARCHPPGAGASAAAGAPVAPPGPAGVPAGPPRLFRTVAGQDCASCHEDVHRGRLGRSCASCHATGGWRETRASAFDHERTAYPLRGRHATVACAACHRPGRPLRPAHDRCTDCHSDAHRGELARRADGGRCESCHDVTGFRPARYGPEEHARTAFPLRGAHLAVACNACHKAAAGAARAGAPAPLRLASARCSDCHADPHRGEMARFAASGCESCHGVESWRAAAFEHGRTGFALDGAHARVACAACHKEAGGAAPRGSKSYRGLGRACAGCHRDPHRGQFAPATGAASCERCHTTAAFRPSTLDHGRDTRFRLEGAHARLACDRCHRRETDPGGAFVRYKPLPTSCSGCHAARPATGGRS